MFISNQCKENQNLKLKITTIDIKKKFSIDKTLKHLSLKMIKN